MGGGQGAKDGKFHTVRAGFRRNQGPYQLASPVSHA